MSYRGFKITSYRMEGDDRVHGVMLFEPNGDVKFFCASQGHVLDTNVGIVTCSECREVMREFRVRLVKILGERAAFRAAAHGRLGRP